MKTGNKSYLLKVFLNTNVLNSGEVALQDQNMKSIIKKIKQLTFRYLCSTVIIFSREICGFDPTLVTSSLKLQKKNGNCLEKVCTNK